MSKIPIHKLKRTAKKMKKNLGLTHAQILQLLAKREGYETWEQLIKERSNG